MTSEFKVGGNFKLVWPEILWSHFGTSRYTYIHINAYRLNQKSSTKSHKSKNRNIVTKIDKARRKSVGKR